MARWDFEADSSGHLAGAKLIGLSPRLQDLKLWLAERDRFLPLYGEQECELD
jgi:hypothetical protein